MPTHRPDLASEVRALVAEHAADLGLNRASLLDVRERALKALPAFTSSGDVAMPGGRSLRDWLDADLRRDAPHLFNPPTPASATPPTVDPRKLKAADRLSLANGDTPPRL